LGKKINKSRGEKEKRSDEKNKGTQLFCKQKKVYPRVQVRGGRSKKRGPLPKGKRFQNPVGRGQRYFGVNL